MSVSAGNRAALLENLLLLAEASRAEPGCIGYEIYENSRDSSRILIFETWRDAASLEAHQQTEHFRLRAPRDQYFTLIHGAFSASQPLTSIGTSVHM